ncbi:MAG: hypothetical protein ACYDBJ_00500 [Aggregatilineales bacterium]
MLDATFNATRTNREAGGTELSVVHSSGVFAEIVGMGCQTIGVELLKDEVDFTFE